MKVIVEKKGEYCIACMKPESSYDILVRYNNGQGSSIPLCKDCMKELALEIICKLREDGQL